MWIKNWIRWSGFAVFSSIALSVGALAYILAGTFVKDAIERQGSEALGAQVSVEEVSLSLSPLGLRLENFEAASPQDPMRNAVAFEQARVEVSLWPLFMGQLVIDNLRVDQVEFDGTRTHSGAYVSATPQGKSDLDSSDEAKAESVAQSDSLSAKEILDREELLTVRLSEEFLALHKSEKQRLDQLRKGLPSKGTYQGYQGEIERLTSTKLVSLEDFQQRKKRLKEIKRAIKEDQALVKQVKNEYRESYKLLSMKLEALKNAPKTDLLALKQKYGLGADGVGKLSQQLLGENLGQWTQQALYWYETVKPFLSSPNEEEVDIARAEGRYIHFEGVGSLPDFLLRAAWLDIALPGGHLTGQLQDVTHQPEVLKRPARLTLRGDDLKGYESVVLNAEFNHIDPNNSLDKADFLIQQMRIDDFTVSGDEQFPLTLVRATADIKGDVAITKDMFELDATFDFSDAQFSSDADSGLAKQLAKVLESIRQFDITLGASGQLDDLHVSIDSSLDEQLKFALKDQLSVKQKALESELKVSLDAKVATLSGTHGDDLVQLRNAEGGLAEQQKALEQMLSSEIANYKAQLAKEFADKKAAERKRAKRKAKDALRKKFGF